MVVSVYAGPKTESISKERDVTVFQKGKNKIKKTSSGFCIQQILS